MKVIKALGLRLHAAAEPKAEYKVKRATKAAKKSAPAVRKRKI